MFLCVQVKIEDNLEQCSVLQEVCPTSELDQFSLPNSTSIATITTTSTTDIQPTSTSTNASTQPVTLPIITAIPLDAPPPATTSAPPATTGHKFVVEPVTEYSEDEESILNEETVTLMPNKIDDTPSGQDERRDSGDTTSDTTPVGDEGRNSATMQSDDDKTLRTESQRSFSQHTPHTTSPYPEGTRGGQTTSDKPIVEHLSSLSESFSVLMYSVLQVLRNPAMESFVKDLDSKYGNGSGPVVHELSQDVEYQNLKMK